MNSLAPTAERLSSPAVANQPLPTKRRGTTFGAASRRTGADPVRRTRQVRAPILSADLFGDVVARERQRVLRTGHAAGLLQADVTAAGHHSGTCGADFWREMVGGIQAAFGPDAVFGWIRQDQILGAVVTDDDSAKHALATVEAATVAPERAVVFRYETWPTDDTVAPAVVPVRSGGVIPTAHLGSRLKRGLDLMGSACLLAVTAPVLLLIAAVLKLTSPGPILFRQTRVGEHGKPFTMLKFRTMRVDADPSLHQAYVTRFIRTGAQVHASGRRVLTKLTDDPRITPAGRLLRRTSLDELPQFWNVLRGDMSLVGPRPPLPYEVQAYQPWHWRRVLEAKPGLTGLWQVVGRSRTTFDEMVRLDIAYARQSSLWTDIRILLATPRAVISGKGAG